MWVVSIDTDQIGECLTYLLINSFTIVRIGLFRVNLNIIMKINLLKKTISRKNGSLSHFHISLISDVAEAR